MSDLYTSRAATILVGDRIREARVRAAYTQSDLARAVGVSQVAVCRWETGTRGLAVGDMCVVAHALGISPASLLIDIEAMPHG